MNHTSGKAPEADAEGHRKARALVILVALAGQEHTALLKLRHNTENPYSSKQNLFSNLDGRTDLGLFSSIKALALRISPSANETFRVLRPVQVLKKLFPSLPKAPRSIRPRSTGSLTFGALRLFATRNLSLFVAGGRGKEL